MQAAVSKAITEQEQEFLPAHQPQLLPFPTVDVTFHRLEQDVQIKLGVAAEEEEAEEAAAAARGRVHGMGERRRGNCFRQMRRKLSFLDADWIPGLYTCAVGLHRRDDGM